MSPETDFPSDRATPQPPLRAQAPAGLSTEMLFRGAQEILIVHKGEQYRLRITRNDKLILTK